MRDDVLIEVFYSETCPNCPPQKELAEKYQNKDDVKVRLSDVAKKKGRAKNHGVRAVPTTVVSGPGIDQKTGFRGVMAEEKMETAIDVARGEKDRDSLENPGMLETIKSLI